MIWLKGVFVFCELSSVMSQKVSEATIMKSTGVIKSRMMFAKNLFTSQFVVRGPNTSYFRSLSKLNISGTQFVSDFSYIRKRKSSKGSFVLSELREAQPSNASIRSFQRRLSIPNLFVS